MLDSATVRRRASSWEDPHVVFYGLRDPVVRRSLLVVLVLAIAGVLFFVWRGGEDRRSFTFSHRYGHLVFGDPSTKRFPTKRFPGVGSVGVIGQPTTFRPGFASTFSSPRVSPATAREAERIARSDPTLARLLRLGDARRAVIGLWSLWGSPQGGAVLLYLLRRPVAVDSDLPYVQIPVNTGSCSKPYAAGRAHLRASGVTTLQVLVDLRRARVAELSTNANRGEVSPVDGKPYPTCSDSGASG